MDWALLSFGSTEIMLNEGGHLPNAGVHHSRPEALLDYVRATDGSGVATGRPTREWSRLRPSATGDFVPARPAWVDGWRIDANWGFIDA